MDIKCNKYRHLWGNSLQVDGVQLSFGPDGIARGVDESIAAALIQSGAYTDVTQHAPTPPKKARAGSK